jgi:hypothetical protein
MAKKNLSISNDHLCKEFLEEIFYPAVSSVIENHFILAKEHYFRTNDLSKLDAFANLLLFLITKGNNQYLSIQLFNEIKSFVALNNSNNSDSPHWSAIYPFELILNLAWEEKYNYKYFITNWTCQNSTIRFAIQEFALWAFYKYDKKLVLDSITFSINSLQFGYDLILAILCDLLDEFNLYQINRLLYLDYCNNPFSEKELFHLAEEGPLNLIASSKSNIKITNSFYKVISEAQAYFIKVIIEAAPKMIVSKNIFQPDFFERELINYAYSSTNENFNKLSEFVFSIEIPKL